MENELALAKLAGLLADRTRATFCLALLDRRAWTAGELAKAAGVAPSTATEHLHRLIEGGLLTEERQGRHRYVRIADPEAADLIEAMAARLPSLDRPAGSLKAAVRRDTLAQGRTCYDHLAGRLGVGLTDALTERGLIEAFAPTETGTTWLTDFGVDLAGLRALRRPLSRPCLDWTERRPHLAGSLAAALCQRMFELGWIARVGSGRAVRPTPEGGTQLAALGVAI